jgi:hypothetical protein
MRVFNLFWIVFCAAIVEMTLNQNNMIQVLARNTKAITAPAQLIPLLIGTVSFLRTLWLVSKEHGRAVLAILRAEESEASNALSRVRRAIDLTIRKIISPGSVKNPELQRAEALKRQESGMHIMFVNHPWPQRYLLAYLPWLSTFHVWKNASQPVLPVDKRYSDVNSPVDEKGDSIVPETREV